MRKWVLAAALGLAACGDDAEYQGISDAQEATLVDQCIATRGEDSAVCVGFIAELVNELEDRECPYAEAARLVSWQLTPESRRSDPPILSCLSDP